MDPNELITVTRWIDNDPEIVLRSRLGERPALPAAWSNGNDIHASVQGFEIVMPAEVWEAVIAEIRYAVATRDLAVGDGSSIVGKDARHVRSNVLTPQDVGYIARSVSS